MLRSWNQMEIKSKISITLCCFVLLYCFIWFRYFCIFFIIIQEFNELRAIAPKNTKIIIIIKVIMKKKKPSKKGNINQSVTMCWRSLRKNNLSVFFYKIIYFWYICRLQWMLELQRQLCYNIIKIKGIYWNCLINKPS